MLLMAIFAPWAVGQTREIVYQKVTETQTDWSGNYLLVYTSSSRAATASISYNMLNSTNVTISNSEIANIGSATIITLEDKGNNKYAIKIGDSYLKRTKATETKLTLASSYDDSDLYRWTLSYSNGIVIKSASTNQSAYFYFHTSYNQFGLQSSSSTVDLYKEATGSDYPAPLNLGYTVESHQATLTWESPSENLTGYAYQYKKSSEESWSELVQVESNVLSCTIGNLDASTSYDFKVKAIYENDPEVNFAEITFTTNVACPVPTGLTCTGYTATTATLEWTSTGAESYEIYLTTDETDVPTPNNTTDITSNTNSKTIENLTAETPYYAYVRGNCGSTDGKSDWSAVCSFTPSAAQNYTANDGTNTNSYIPFYGTWGDTKGTEGQYIIPSSALTPMVYGQITQIVLYGDPNKSYGATFNVRLAEVSQTTFTSSLYSGDMTTVFSGSLSTDANGLLVIPFTTNFTYNGGNLLVDFYVSESGSGYPSCSWKGVNTSTNTAFIHYSSSNLAQTFLPKTTFTYIPGTEPDCYAPKDLQADNITASSADLSWTKSNNTSTCKIQYRAVGASEWVEKNDITEPYTSYTLSGLNANTTYEYQVMGVCNGEDTGWSSSYFFTTDCGAYNLPYSYGFESDADMSCWKMESCTSGTGRTQNSGINNSYGFKFNYNTNPPQFLISPELSGGDQYGVKVEFSYKAGGYYEESFMVGYSTSTNAVSSFENNWDDEITYSSSSWATYSHVFPAGTKYVAIKYTANDKSALNVDNISFTVPENTFTIEGNWNFASNWLYGTLPTDADDVVINAACTIPANCIAEANSITFGTNGSLTIADGGQLFTNNAVQATVQKYIKGRNNGGGWNFVASPICFEANPSTVGMLTGDYDLYRFNPLVEPDDQGKIYEWENYKVHTNDFSLYNGHGYLYANLNDVNLVFAGMVNNPDAVSSYEYEDEAPSNFREWHLVGNPYMYAAYPNTSYYVVSGSTIAEPETSGAVAPCEGIMIQGTDGLVNFTRTPANKAQPSNLKVTLAQQVAYRGTVSSAKLDKAIISFNEGSQLSKFYFGENKANIYIPQGNEKYAIVYSEGMGEMPLNFRANENGNYTLSFSSENTEFSYLHLIDNMTGNDVDLLQTPSYSFNATSTDYESRFKLVFATGAADGSETFAFFSNGSFVINNEGNATLQVIDITGRILSSKTINGCANVNVNAAPGVYMLRLVNGANVKVQKVVVK